MPPTEALCFLVWMEPVFCLSVILSVCPIVPAAMALSTRSSYTSFRSNRCSTCDAALRKVGTGGNKRVVSWPATVWGLAVVMVRVVRLSVCLLHANISETKRDRHMVTY